MSRRILSLLPSATEIVASLSAVRELVGVSHACDFPEGLQDLPILTKSIVDPGLSQKEIDTVTSAALRRGESLYRLDEELLRELSPDVVITQALCDVCAISYSSVERAVHSLGSSTELISLEPDSIEGVLSDISRLGASLGREREAADLVRDARARLADLRSQVKGVIRPRVLGLEWFDPPYFGGHWVPEQIEAAGGTPVVGAAGARSERMSWKEIQELDPDVIFLMPCGYDASQAVELMAPVREQGEWKGLRAVTEGRVWAVDANALFSRPGPRIIEGAEQLGHLLHPNRVPRPAKAKPAIQLPRPA